MATPANAWTRARPIPRDAPTMRTDIERPNTPQQLRHTALSTQKLVYKFAQKPHNTRDDDRCSVLALEGRVPTSMRRASTLCDSAKSCRPLPRATWGADLAPKGPMAPEDVRFLLVHHTATSNRIPDQCQLIRNIFAFHTSNAKRWNDVAHNYFVGPDGTVWEGRAGSLDGPVAPTPPAATRVSANWCACSATSRRPRRRRQCNTVSSCCSHTSRDATT